MKMIKHFSILTVISTLLISGCMDLSDSNSGSGSENEFFGVWEECNSSSLTTLTFSEGSIVVKDYTFENSDCTGNSTENTSREFGVTYGDEIIVSSGVVATRIKITPEDSPELEILDLLYINGNNLYFGDETGTEDTWPTNINFGLKFTLQ